jgi:TorA maturation chaperone TorD
MSEGAPAPTPMRFVPTLPPEEVARANFYGLLARLFYAPPDAALLEALAGAGDLEAEEGELADAWRSLTRAAEGADPEALRDEYDTVFVGTGKSPVTLYVSAYSVQYSNEVPLVALKADLAALGLARRADRGEPEDHIAALCDVMRHLISESHADLAAQKHFFERWIWPNVEPLCVAIEENEVTGFYKAVAAFLYALCSLEHKSFEML